jgi:2-dehydro-3-deoxyphosphooctonate aldolase (KDO 8-P synthase)
MKAKQRKVRVGQVTFGNTLPFVLIAGPDSIESEEHALFMARSLKAITKKLGVPFVFKASYDKANRTSHTSFRGVGLKEGVRILKLIKEKVGVSVTTDIHSKEEAREMGVVVDLLQVPALLSRQTDLLLAAGEYGRAVNIKKGQFISPRDALYPIEKVVSSKNTNILITERGHMFGYRDVVADMRALFWMREFGYPVIFDAAHTAQFPSSEKGKSGGEARLIPSLAFAAIAIGVSGIFIEVHNNPSEAPVDGDSSLPLKELAPLLRKLKALDRIAKSS